MELDHCGAGAARRAVVDAPRAVVLGLVSAMLCGCIATHRVTVPPIEIVAKVELQDTSERVGLDIVCPGLYEEFAFVALVKGTLRQDESPGNYYWTNQQVTRATPFTSSCSSVTRLIDELVWLTPSPERGRWRTVFVRIVGDNALYRISLERASEKVEGTDLETARRTLPATLAGDLRNVPWGDRIIDAHETFYRTIRWTPTNKVAVANIQRINNGDVVSVVIIIRR
ncbi:MAG: hypothetical protein ACREEM_49535 [Blastocatellia bacterium]